MATPTNRPGRTRIKVCGIRDSEALHAAVDAGADSIGLMFVESSPRYVKPADGFALMAELPPMVTAVGVIADATVEQFLAIEEVCPTPIVQLHGSETIETARRCGPGVIKAIRFDPHTIRDDLAKWNEVEEVESILIDGSAGGEGVAFAWDALAEAAHTITTPIIVAGGLDPDNVGDAIRACRPFAVDVSSGVERERGIKDPARIRAFCDAVRDADSHS